MKGSTNSATINIYEDLTNLVPINSDYQLVNYIKSNGDIYIDTGVLGHSNMSSELLFEFDQVPSDGCLFGSAYTRSSSSISDRIYFYHYFQGHRLGYKFYYGTGKAEVNVVYKVKTRLDVGHQYQYVNDVLTYEGYQEDIVENNTSLYIFALHEKDSTTFYSNAKVYYIKLWDGSDLIRYFVPAYRRSDNHPGLYDCMTNTFLVTQGEGTPVLGEELYIPMI